MSSRTGQVACIQRCSANECAPHADDRQVNSSSYCCRHSHDSRVDVSSRLISPHSSYHPPDHTLHHAVYCNPTRSKSRIDLQLHCQSGKALQLSLSLAHRRKRHGSIIPAVYAAEPQVLVPPALETLLSSAAHESVHHGDTHTRRDRDTAPNPRTHNTPLETPLTLNLHVSVLVF